MKSRSLARLLRMQQGSVYKFVQLIVFSKLSYGLYFISCIFTHRFSINLQCGPNTSPRDDVALHLTADFTRRLFLRNSIHSMSWGMEENQGGMPLHPGQQFHITIVIEASQFTVRLRTSLFETSKIQQYNIYFSIL